MLKSLLFIPLVILLSGAVDDPRVDSTQVRYGNLSAIDWKESPKVGIVRSKEVYKEIPEYKLIKKEKIEKGTARYTQLMQICTNKYRKSLSIVADGKYELIVEQGGISNYPITDITKKAISYIKKIGL